MIRTKRFWVLVTLAVFLFGALACSSPSPEPESAEKAPEPKMEEPVKEPEPAETAKLEPPPPEPKAEPKPAKAPEPKPEPPKAPARPTVVMKTSKGNITVELDPDRAPVTVKNFLQYVDDKFYDGTIFHRVIANFMIQGGGFTPEMKEKPNRPPIKIESGNGLANLRGSIAMARTGDPNSATSQFYINHKTNRALDKDQDPRGFGYAVFGKVTAGLDVVDAIAAVPTGMHPAGHVDVPREPVVIKSIRRAN